MLDSITDTFMEYRDYLVDASDTISNFFSMIMNGVKGEMGNWNRK